MSCKINSALCATIALVACVALGGAHASVSTPQTPLAGTQITPFVDPLPTFAGRRADGRNALAVNMVEFQQKILPAALYAGLAAPFDQGTYLWGYDIDGAGPSWPARTIEVQQNTPTTVTYSNGLTGTFLKSLLTYDQTIHWADPLGTTTANNCVDGPPLAAPCTQPFTGPIPAVVHLHGAEVPSAFDGHPDSWFTPGQTHTGAAFVSNVYTYPNQQEATTLWFHDHALGVVRDNVYAGLAGFYLIRDDRDTGRADNPIKLPAGAQEVELMLQDRQFDTNGQLYFPDSDNPANLDGPPSDPDKHPFWIPEFFGDVITVNGKSWPYLDVQPRRYRFRFVNGSNARFFLMQMFDQTGAAGPAMWQIGSDGGLLDAPVELGDPAKGAACAVSPIGNNINPDAAAGCLFLAPAERADVIVDFGGQAGKTFTLKNFAVVPFPSGGPVGFGAPDATADGLVMQFRVNQPLQGADATFDPSVRGAALRAARIVNIKRLKSKTRRQLVLVEEEASMTNPGGPGSPVGGESPVESLINNTKWNGNQEGATTAVAGSTPNGKGISATETPQQGSKEIWEVANLTGDAHPIHIHLVQFQVVSRRTFDADDYLLDWMAAFPGGTFNGVNFPPGKYIPGFGPPRPYDVLNSAHALGGNLNFKSARYTRQGACAHHACRITKVVPSEAGWKDTVKMLPATITTLAIRWAPQDLPAHRPKAGRNPYPFDPTAGPGYVEHCHILDHEDNEFMRPMLIVR